MFSCFYMYLGEFGGALTEENLPTNLPTLLQDVCVQAETAVDTNRM